MGLFDQAGHIRINANGVNAEIPLAPAVVLFGPNDAGKTNVIRTIANLMRGEAPENRDPFGMPTLDSEELGMYGSRWIDAVVFALDLSRRDHRQLFLDCVSAGGRFGVPAFRVPADDRPSVEVGNDWGFGDPHEDADEMVESLRSALIEALVPPGESHPPGLEGAIDAVLAGATVELGSKISALYVEGWAAAATSSSDGSLAELLDRAPEFVALSGYVLQGSVDLVDSDSFEAPQAAFHEMLVDRILKLAGWERTEPGHSDDWAFMGFDDLRDFRTQRHEPWFDDGTSLASDDVIDACERVSELATRLAPGFITSDYRIEVQPVEPRWWVLNEGQRLRVALVPNDRKTPGRYEGEPLGFGLDAVGSGLRLWTMFAVYEALRRSLGSRQKATLFVFDEPERHLHPVAQRQAAAFIASLVSEGANVIVATHAPAFLNEPIPHARYVRLSRTDGTTRAFPLGDGQLAAVEAARLELGLTQADLIALTRRVLLVEGEHDRLIVESFYGKELADAYARVIPIRGTHNTLSLLDANLLGQLGIPVFLMLDGTSTQFIEDLNRGRLTQGRTKEERALAELAIALRDKRFTVAHVPLGVPDIVWTLPEAAVKQVAPKFPGWKAATAELRAHHGAINPKKLLLDRYNLRVTLTTLGQMTAIAHEQSLQPTNELKAALASVLR